MTAQPITLQNAHDPITQTLVHPQHVQTMVQELLNAGAHVRVEAPALNVFNIIVLTSHEEVIEANPEVSAPVAVLFVSCQGPQTTFFDLRGPATETFPGRKTMTFGPEVKGTAAHNAFLQPVFMLLGNY